MFSLWPPVGEADHPLNQSLNWRTLQVTPKDCQSLSYFSPFAAVQCDTLETGFLGLRSAGIPRPFAQKLVMCGVKQAQNAPRASHGFSVSSWFRASWDRDGQFQDPPGALSSFFWKLLRVPLGKSSLSLTRVPLECRISLSMELKPYLTRRCSACSV